MMKIPRFGLFEQSCHHTGSYDNPYKELMATVQLTEPNGKTTRSIPLFWDGDTIWKLRFSPDKVGTWKWSVQSDNPGLNRQSGSFNVVDSQNRGGIRPMAGYPYHFERQNGEPFWFMGETGWALYTDNQAKNHTRTAVEEYIDTRARQGFNVIHSMLISESGWGNSGGDAFVDLKTEKINPEYWQEADERLIYLNRRGITGGLVLAWADKRVNPNDWREFPSQEARLRYARYVTARYSAFDVYFVVAGEWNADVRNAKGLSENQIRSDYIAIGNTIKQSDPHGRMIAIHPFGNDSVREFAQQPWMGFGDYQQMYRHLHDEILASRRFDKPVVNAEYAYYLRDADCDGQVDKPNSFDLQSMRHATWDIAMACGYFITGFGTTYFGGYRNPGPFDVNAVQNDDWEEQIQHVKRLFSELEWWRLRPYDEFITAQIERDEDRSRQVKQREVVLPPKITYWVLAEPGRQYLAYVRGHAGLFKLSLGERGNGTYHLRQFDPRTGEFINFGTRQCKGFLEYTPPDERDWVLVVEK